MPAAAGKLWRIGLAGAGTVGCGLVELLYAQADLIRARTGAAFMITAIAARDPHKKRPVDLSAFPFVSDPRELVARNDVDVIVELVGGIGDPAYALINDALHAQKPVVSANKALLATHGGDLSRIAHDHRTPLLFEGAVGGGTPMIKLLREGLSGNRITRLAGILNGTCNYILSTMEKTGQEFDDVLRDAQAKGYAEADPALDIDGHDTAHKLAILQTLVTQTPPDLSAISVTGIRDITRHQIKGAAAKSYRIKLLGVIDNTGPRVAPHLVPIRHPLAGVDDAFNALSYTGDLVGTGFIHGRGAGALPTASAVMADLIDLAAGRAAHTHGLWPFNAHLPRAALPVLDSPVVKDPDLGLPVWG